MQNTYNSNFEYSAGNEGEPIETWTGVDFVARTNGLHHKDFVLANLFDGKPGKLLNSYLNMSSKFNLKNW